MADPETLRNKRYSSAPQEYEAELYLSVWLRCIRPPGAPSRSYKSQAKRALDFEVTGERRGPKR
jgi:hypothetical protein